MADGQSSAPVAHSNPALLSAINAHEEALAELRAVWHVLVDLVPLDRESPEWLRLFSFHAHAVTETGSVLFRAIDDQGAV
jgi:hypothetical protein